MQVRNTRKVLEINLPRARTGVCVGAAHVLATVNMVTKLTVQLRCILTLTILSRPYHLVHTHAARPTSRTLSNWSNTHSRSESSSFSISNRPCADDDSPYCTGGRRRFKLSYRDMPSRASSLAKFSGGYPRIKDTMTCCWDTKSCSVLPRPLSVQ